MLVDQAGNPAKSISPNDAALFYANGKAGWDIGDDVALLGGGHGKTGLQSTLAIKLIISMAGSGQMVAGLRHALPLSDQNFTQSAARARSNRSCSLLTCPCVPSRTGHVVVKPAAVNC